jgi:uncharacterized iron-regulated membrane protein
MKKKFFTVHKYLGLITGIVIFIEAVTGCLWVFKDEIESLYKPTYEIELQQIPVITATDAAEKAQAVFPDNTIHGTLYLKDNDPVEVIFYEEEPKFYQSVFLHPYDGSVLNVGDHLSGFFAFVMDGHISLWLPGEIGAEIIAFSVLLFIFILISGFYLWWPRSKKKKQRFKFEWRAITSWKRKNFDLHAVIGFYVFFLALILAYTGTVMGYDWFYYLTYKSMGGNNAPQFIIPENNEKFTTDDDLEIYPMDQLIPKLKKENPEAVSLELHYPATDSSSIYVEIASKEGVYYSSDYRFFDQTTLAEIETPSIYGKYKNANFADKVIRMNYDIHVGAIGGFPGKIIAFLSSLLIATLPITGVFLWFGRKNKKG